METWDLFLRVNHQQMPHCKTLTLIDGQISEKLEWLSTQTMGFLESGLLTPGIKKCLKKHGRAAVFLQEIFPGCGKLSSYLPNNVSSDTGLPLFLTLSLGLAG